MEYKNDDDVFVHKYLINAKTYYGIDKPLYNYVVGNPNSIMGQVFTKTNNDSKYDFIFSKQDFYDYLNMNCFNKNLISYFIEDTFGMFRLYYFLLPEEDRQQAFTYIKEFINKNDVLLSHKGFKKLKLANSIKKVEKIFSCFDFNIKWYQYLFSVRNIPNRAGKICRILGFSIILKNKKSKKVQDEQAEDK